MNFKVLLQRTYAGLIATMQNFCKICLTSGMGTYLLRFLLVLYIQKRQKKGWTKKGWNNQHPTTVNNGSKN